MPPVQTLASALRFSSVAKMPEKTVSRGLQAPVHNRSEFVWKVSAPQLAWGRVLIRAISHGSAFCDAFSGQPGEINVRPALEHAVRASDSDAAAVALFPGGGLQSKSIGDARQGEE